MIAMTYETISEIKSLLGKSSVSNFRPIHEKKCERKFIAAFIIRRALASFKFAW